MGWKLVYSWAMLLLSEYNLLGMRENRLNTVQEEL
jgi:hypothetical protein